MSDTPLISVIVPIYKVESYLRRCIDSIRNQEYENLEILLVDDGSPDNCGLICDEYANHDKRIKVIHKENGGLSDARNSALEVMNGEYVTFVDSDDFISRFYIKNLYEAIKEKDCDISASWFVNYNEGDKVLQSRVVETTEIKKLSKVEAYKRMLYQDGFEISAWGKLYKSSLFANVRYPIGKLYEDIPTTYKLMEKTDKIAVIPQVDYYYLQRNDSIAQATFSLKKMDGVDNMDNLRQFITDTYPELKEASECRYFSTVCNILMTIKKEDGYDREKLILWEEIKKYRKSVMRNREGRIKARIASIISYLGYDIMKFVYCVIVK